ncbi:hypothetical protein [Streptomyces viridochromogenes]|uniref:hypothetical protein n=1 Tax=Streptomyces viridochromogenes TaxID=1938 RepID=UPI000561E32D
MAGPAELAPGVEAGSEDVQAGLVPPRAEGAAGEVGQGLAVAGQDRVDEQVGGAQGRVVQVEAVGRFRGC